MSTTSQTEQGTLSPPEPDLTPAEMIARAVAMRPELRAAQAATEEQTYYSQETHEAFVDAGFYRLYIPRRYGGYEFDVPTFVKLTIEVARGCPSTGWCMSLATAHALQLCSWFEEETQNEILGGGGHFAMASAAQPIGVAERTDDGWRLSGKAGYCSGIPYSTHYMGQALMGPPTPDAPPRLLLFLAPKESFTVLNDWGDIIGLKGSGSHSIAFDGAEVPAHWTLEDTFVADVDVSKGTPGLRLHGNPMYAGRMMATFTGNLAAVMVGAAYAALDEYEEMLNSKMTFMPPFQPRRLDPDFQRWFGAAIAKIGTAEAALLNMADQHMELCARAAEDPSLYTYFEDYRLACIAREVMHQCWDVVQSELWRTIGSSAGAKGQRFERLFRDLATGSGHRNLSLRDFMHGDIARAHLGVAPHGLGSVS
ncbi:MAG: acyl-CoA dehydrogenase [Conexibacter sp.]|nr:acyl-CoA dehydrogenase [Conexibacter sp.]